MSLPHWLASRGFEARGAGGILDDLKPPSGRLSRGTHK